MQVIHSLRMSRFLQKSITQYSTIPLFSFALGLRKNNFIFSHSIFNLSLPAPQSQNPRNPDWIGIPVDLLNRRSQI
jgi:hypothetical protein